VFGKTASMEEMKRFKSHVKKVKKNKEVKNEEL